MRALIAGTTSADFSGTATKTVQVSGLERFLGYCDRLGILEHYIDPETAGAVNTRPATSREKVNDAVIRYGTGAPTLAGSTAGINDKQVFNWTSYPDADAIVDVTGFPASWTFICPVIPSTFSLDGDDPAYLMQTFDTAERNFFASAAAATPALAVMAREQVVTWQFGANLVAGDVHLVAATANAVTKRVAIWADDPVTPKASSIVTNAPIAYPSAKMRFGGANTPTVRSWKGKMGKALLFNQDLSALNGGAFLRELWAQYQAYYAL